MIKKEKCFVLRPIGQVESETRINSNFLYDEIIKPTCDFCGFENTKFAGDSDRQRSITPDIIQSILNADLIVADLTGQNANVFYELALAHAVRKPCVTLFPEGKQLPFDVKDYDTTFYALYVEYKNVQQNNSEAQRVRKQLEAKINACIEDAENALSPIDVGIDIFMLRSGGRLERAVADNHEKTQKILDMLLEPDKTFEFKLYEKLENIQLDFESISEELVMDLQHDSHPRSDWILDKVREMEAVVQSLPTDLPQELSSLSISALLDLARQIRR